MRNMSYLWVFPILSILVACGQTKSTPASSANSRILYNGVHFKYDDGEVVTALTKLTKMGVTYPTDVEIELKKIGLSNGRGDHVKDYSIGDVEFSVYRLSPHFVIITSRLNPMLLNRTEEIVFWGDPRNVGSIIIEYSESSL